MHRSNFVHLHNHTEYSLLDGACRILEDKKPAELFRVVSNKFKMDSLAITDHGNMFGAIEFYEACLESGIKPIIGCEVYMAKGSRLEKDSKTYSGNYHLTLLAHNNTGYRNLMKLVSIGYTEGFYRKPRVDFESLQKYSDGLICLSGCLQGEIPRAILDGKSDEAVRIIGKYKELFGKHRFYLELMDNGIPEQKIVARKLSELAKALDVELVATNDCHYLYKSDASLHEILLCIDTGTTLDDPDRLKFSTDNFYYRSPEEMVELFKDIPAAVKNTLKISEMCAVELNMGQFLLPEYKVPAGFTPISYLEKLCTEGLKKRYTPPSEEHYARLRRELALIDKMNFAEYFLIVWDFIEYARKNNIPVGHGRGSGAGSIVAYALHITNICPIKYGLLFERFLNPDRRTMPDLDIDFADVGRDKVIDYVRHKYGAERVAQIITYSAMQSRLAIKDVARVMGYAASDANRLSSMIPFNMSVYEAVQKVDELKKIYKTDEKVKNIIDVASKIEGLKRHTGVHAAGVVIAKDDITNYVPMSISKKDNSTVTQYDGDSLLKLGLLKIDILGIKTLSVVDECKNLIKKRRAIEIKDIPPDDAKTYKLFKDAKTLGVFQLESSGMRDLLRKLKPTNIEDIIALISLYRPGPMGAGMLDDFVARKHQKIKIVYDHPLLEPILRDTYGVILYQEHVMKIAQSLAGFSAGQADLLRRAMSKKVPEEMEKLENDFVAGCKKNFIDSKTARKIFEQIKFFAGYGFNKSHAAAYAILAYETAYLKANYTIEFMTALINSEIGRTTKKEEDNKIVMYLKECENYGINILPPSINKSEPLFSIEGNDIRYGLLAIKNVGENAAAHIKDIRKSSPYKSPYDFILRTMSHHLNRRTIESLIKSGAFDEFGESAGYVRAEFLAKLDNYMEFTSGIINNGGAGSLLFGIDETEPKFNVEVNPFSEHECLKQEKEVLGCYLSGHPLAKHEHELLTYSTHRIKDLLSETPPRTVIKVAGVIENVKKLVTKGKKETYVRFLLEDTEADIEVVVFPRDYKNGMAPKIKGGNMVVVRGKLNDRETREIIAEDIVTLEEARKTVPVRYEKMTIKMIPAGFEEDSLNKLKKLFLSHPGETRVYVEASLPQAGRYLIDTEIGVKVDKALFENVKKIVGEENIVLTKA